MKFSIDKEEVIDYFDGETYEFPKYATQIINLANGNAQATRPKQVGQMSELFPAYLNTAENPSITDWQRFYASQHPDSIKNAVEKIMVQIRHFQQVIDQIDDAMVENWVKDLIYNKTFKGLNYESLVLKKIAEWKGTDYRKSDASEESIGIDGYIGGVPHSVKPHTYKTKDALFEEIGAVMVFYEMKKDGSLKIEIPDRK